MLYLKFFIWLLNFFCSKFIVKVYFRLLYLNITRITGEYNLKPMETKKHGKYDLLANKLSLIYNCRV
ncbi:hypothetical protein NUSPORA_02720 [Nucleospora cyclopteri]